MPLSRSAQNFAPLDPIAKLLRDKKLPKQPTKFEKSVQTLYQSKLAYQSAAWNEIYSMAQLVALFRQGQQLLVPKKYGVGFYVRPIASDDTYRQTAMSFMGFHSQVCEAKIGASNPNVNIRAADDSPEAIATAQACRPVVDCYENEWYTSKFIRREAISLLTNGMFIHRVRWNPFKGGQSVQSRQVEKVQQQTDNGYGECLDCPASGDAEDFGTGQCPQCQGSAVSVRPPTIANLSRISMGASMPVGEPEIIATPLMGWRWDLAKDLEDSSWAIYRQRISQGAVNLMLGDVVIPNSGSSEDYGLDMLRVLNYAGQAWAGGSRNSYYGSAQQQDTRPTMAEFWLSAEDQAEIECDAGDTVCGMQMPKGRLSDFFKGEPICIVGLNDMAVVVGTYAKESHQNEVVTGQWIMQAESGVGRGMEDVAAVQKRFNAIDGQIYQGLATTATPAAITDMSLFKEDQANYLFRPGVNIDVNLALLPPNMRLQDAFYLPNAGNINQQYITYGSVFLKQMADISSFAVEFSNVLEIDNRTATGAQITNALANSLYGPMLATKGQARVRIAQMIVELHRSHSAASRYFAGNGNAKGRMVAAGDLKGKVIFELVQNSELPVTPFSQQTDVRVFFEAFGGAPLAAQIKASDPDFFRATSAPFNINWGNDSDDDISTLCLSRLEQMRSNLMAGVDDPAMLTQRLQPPVSMYEPKHKEKKLWWSMYLDLQQGQKAPLALRVAAEQMYLTHQNFDMKQRLPQAANEGLIAGTGQAAAAAPSALGQAAIQNAQGGGDPGQAADHAHDAEQAHHDREQEALTTIAAQKHEAQLKAMEIAGQQKITAMQGENAAQTARIAGDNAVRAAKAKPKPKTTKAA